MRFLSHKLIVFCLRKWKHSSRTLIDYHDFELKMKNWARINGDCCQKYNNKLKNNNHGRGVRWKRKDPHIQVKETLSRRVWFCVVHIQPNVTLFRLLWFCAVHIYPNMTLTSILLFCVVHIRANVTLSRKVLFCVVYIHKTWHCLGLCGFCVVHIHTKVTLSSIVWFLSCLHTCERDV